MKLTMSNHMNELISQITVQQSTQMNEKNEQQVIDIPNEKSVNDKLWQPHTSANHQMKKEKSAKRRPKTPNLRYQSQKARADLRYGLPMKLKS